MDNNPLYPRWPGAHTLSTPQPDTFTLWDHSTHPAEYAVLPPENTTGSREVGSCAAERPHPVYGSQSERATATTKELPLEIAAPDLRATDLRAPEITPPEITIELMRISMSLGELLSLKAGSDLRIPLSDSPLRLSIGGVAIGSAVLCERDSVVVATITELLP